MQQGLREVRSVHPGSALGSDLASSKTSIISRRTLFTSFAGAILVNSVPAMAQPDAFTTLLSQIASDPDMVEASWLYREPNITKGVGRGTPSKRKLNKSASDLIISCEVSSPAAYESRYRRPIWPKGQSGVTIGIGYDLAFSNRNYIERDWPHLLKADRDLLAKVIVLRGTKAQDALPVVASVDIPWTQAQEQFLAFLPYPTSDTERAFPNCDKLSDDSFGALVSLVYNRGSAIDRNSRSRSEMYDIQQLMKAKKFAEIPERIQHMKRLWTTSEARGVAIRRDAEAALFKRGVQNMS